MLRERNSNCLHFFHRNKSNIIVCPTIDVGINFQRRSLIFLIVMNKKKEGSQIKKSVLLYYIMLQ